MNREYRRRDNGTASSRVPRNNVRTTAQRPRSGERVRSERISNDPASAGRSGKQVFAYRTKHIISTGIKPMLLISKNEGRIKTVKSKKKTPIPFSVFLIAAICTIVFMFMIVSYVQINEYTIEVSELKSEFAQLAEQEKDLNLQLDKKNDLRNIEKYASENLGMVKSDQIVKKHVSVTSEDKIEVMSSKPIPDDNLVTTMMSSIFGSFRGLREYIK